jgi:hypothetical protein
MVFEEVCIVNDSFGDGDRDMNGYYDNDPTVKVEVEFEHKSSKGKKEQ